MTALLSRSHFISRPTALLGALLYAGLLGGCIQRADTPPTIQELRVAHDRGEEARASFAGGIAHPSRPIVIPDQTPICKPEGDMHFDCSLAVFVGSDATRAKTENVHVWKDEGAWRMESLD